MDDVVLIEVLGSKPIHSLLTFLSHVGNDGSLVKALVCVDRSVEEDNLDTGILCVLKNGIPTGCTCSGDKEIIHLILDELLSGCDLLVILKGIVEGCIVSVLFSERVLHISVIGSTITGLVGIVVDDTDPDQSVVVLCVSALSTGASNKTEG